MLLVDRPVADVVRYVTAMMAAAEQGTKVSALLHLDADALPVAQQLASVLPRLGSALENVLVAGCFVQHQVVLHKLTAQAADGERRPLDRKVPMILTWKKSTEEAGCAESGEVKGPRACQVRERRERYVTAVRLVFEEVRAVPEPAGALAVAGALAWAKAHPEAVHEGARWVSVVSGANVNFDRLGHVVERCALGDGSEALLAVTIPERAGSFSCRAHQRSSGIRLIS